MYPSWLGLSHASQQIPITSCGLNASISAGYIRPVAISGAKWSKAGDMEKTLVKGVTHSSVGNNILAAGFFLIAKRHYAFQSG